MCEGSTETQELLLKENGRGKCLKHYMETNTFSWREVAKASYVCNEVSVIEKLLHEGTFCNNNIIVIYYKIYTDDKMQTSRQNVHRLLNSYVCSSDDYGMFYQQLHLRPPSENWPKLASIDYWLLTCPLSWRELAWCFYKCNIPSAVIEIKKEFIKGM